MHWRRIVGIIVVMLFILIPLVLVLITSLPSDTETGPPCANGTAVPDPQDNPGLVADCTVLLHVRDTLAGTGAPTAPSLIGTASRSAASSTYSHRESHRPGGDNPSRVIELDLSERRFSGNVNGTIPPELGELTALTVLDLRNNHLSGRIPPELGALTALTVLDLRNNYLTGPIPPELGALANLQGLALNNNQLTGPTPPELDYLTQLEYVSLHKNALTECLPPALRRIPENDFEKLGLPFCGA